MDAIRTFELSKSYGQREVLHRVELCVPAGSLFGFLGPNGAGKTTTIRILLGLLRASHGRATILGRDVWAEGPALRAEVGYLPGDIRFYDQMTGRRTLRFLAAARRRDCRVAIEHLADRFDLDLDKRIRNYSRGMKQKLGLIQALMHRPGVLVLDEPTTALDPLVRETLYAELRAAAAEGRTVLFSSHTLSEVEALCDWVAIVRNGRLIEQERIEVLRQRAVRHVEIHFARDAAGRGPAPPGGLPLNTSSSGAPQASASSLNGSSLSTPPAGLRVLRQADGRLAGSWAGPMDTLVAWLAANRVDDLSIAPPDLEDLFMTYYADDHAAGGERP